MTIGRPDLDMTMSESRRLQAKTAILRKAEHHVHILHSLPSSPLDQIVNCRSNMYISLMQFHMYQSLVRIDYVLHRDIPILVKYKRRSRIIIVIYLPIILDCHSLNSPGIDTGKDSTCKITPERNEIHYWLSTVSNSCDILLNFSKMLVGEQLVNGDIVIPPAEMGGLSWFFPCSGRTCDCGYMDLINDESGIGKRKKCKLDCRGKASRIGNVMSLAYVLTCTFT